MSGIYDTDTDMEKDSKFLTWIGKRKYRVIDLARYAQEREWAIDDAIEILIIKE